MKLDKKKFLQELSESISKIPKSEVDRILNYYTEMIDDLTETGLSEEEAVQKIGDIKEISSKILEDNCELKSESNLSKFINFILRVFSSKWRLLSFTILTLGFPIWCMVIAPVLMFLFVGSIFIFMIPVMALGCSVHLLWDPLTYYDLFNVLYFIGLSLTSFGIAALYISTLTTFVKFVCKHVKALFERIKGVKTFKKGCIR